MKRNNKILVGVLCIFCAMVSFLFYINRNRFTLEGLLATININVEIDKNYINDLSIVTEPHKDIIIQLTPTGSLANDLKTTIIHVELRNQYAQGISIRVPAVMSREVISSIDSVSVFIGNKLFYFYSSDIAAWKYTENGDSVDYAIPVGMYKKSFIKPWINWYGDLNFILVEVVQLITKPFKFLFVHVFFIIFLLMFIREIQTILKKYNKQAEIMLLILLLTFAFLLRVDGMTRYSAWNDELASVVFANPNSSIKSIFADGANPFFYHLLLRIWFTITGWSETTGRLLSVLLGTGGILTLYLFVKSICGRKYAFISAFLLSISYTSLGYSNEMRSYAFLIMLCPLISLSFIHFLKNPGFKNSCIYVVLGIVLVNTHYYAIWLIAGNFFFYFMFNHYTLKRMVYFCLDKQKRLEWLKIIKYLFMNFIIALSLVPFFIIAGNKVILNEKTMTWMPKPGKRELIYGIILLLIFIANKILIIIDNKYGKFDKKKIFLLNYSVFITMFIYLAAYIVSISYRNIFTYRYLSICIPFIVSILPIFIFFVLLNVQKDFYIIFCVLGNKYLLNIQKYLYKYQIVASFILLILFSNFINNWLLLNVGNTDVFKESREYILKDSINYDSTAEIMDWKPLRYRVANEYYGGPPTPEYYTGNNKYDAFYYMNPADKSEQTMNDILIRNNFNMNNILKIRLIREPREIKYREIKYIYKIKEYRRFDEKYNISSNGKNIGEITENVVIKQTFLSNDKNLCAIQIMFATYGRINTSTISLQLYDENDVLINEKTIQNATMLDRSYSLFYKFDNIDDSLGKKYTLVISSKDAVPGNAVTIWCTNKNSFGGDLFINGQQQTDNLCIIPEYDKQ